MAPEELPDVLDLDEVPEPMQLTEERLREAVGDDPGPLRRYLHGLAAAEAERCHKAVRGAGGLYWPCVRPRHPGERYCFGHLDPATEPHGRRTRAGVLRRLRSLVRRR